MKNVVTPANNSKGFNLLQKDMVASQQHVVQKQAINLGGNQLKQNINIQNKKPVTGMGAAS